VPPCHASLLRRRGGRRCCWGGYSRQEAAREPDVLLLSDSMVRSSAETAATHNELVTLLLYFCCVCALAGRGFVNANDRTWSRTLPHLPRRLARRHMKNTYNLLVKIVNYRKAAKDLAVSRTPPPRGRGPRRETGLAHRAPRTGAPSPSEHPTTVAGIQVRSARPSTRPWTGLEAHRLESN